MGIQPINDIRNIVDRTVQQEKDAGQLEKYLRGNLEQLHQAINLPPGNSVATLVGFVVRYIEHVPNFLEAMYKLSQEAGIENDTQVFITITLDFFLNPPENLSEQSGLMALMDEAYLAHRLMEEVNDRFIGRCGIPLVPMDMTRSNLIVHHLIGEPFANNLDEVVHFSVEQLMDKQKIFDNPLFLDYVIRHREKGWRQELQRWPCLAHDLSIGLNFGIAEGVEHGYLSRLNTLH